MTAYRVFIAYSPGDDKPYGWRVYTDDGRQNAHLMYYGVSPIRTCGFGYKTEALARRARRRAGWQRDANGILKNINSQ